MILIIVSLTLQEQQDRFISGKCIRPKTSNQKTNKFPSVGRMRILSDLHLERYPSGPAFDRALDGLGKMLETVKDPGVLILAGGITTYRLAPVILPRLFQLVRRWHSEIVYVLGACEFPSPGEFKRAATLEYYGNICKEWDVRLLENEEYVTEEEVISIWGSTFWFSGPGHLESRKALRNHLELVKRYHPSDDTIVVTYFPPSLKFADPPKFPGSDSEDLLYDSKVDGWVFGQMNRPIREGHIWCNPQVSPWVDMISKR